jgi:hypothetical protein
MALLLTGLDLSVIIYCSFNNQKVTSMEDERKLNVLLVCNNKLSSFIEEIKGLCANRYNLSVINLAEQDFNEITLNNVFNALIINYEIRNKHVVRKILEGIREKQFSELYLTMGISDDVVDARERMFSVLMCMSADMETIAESLAEVSQLRQPEDFKINYFDLHAEIQKANLGYNLACQEKPRETIADLKKAEQKARKAKNAKYAKSIAEKKNQLRLVVSHKG